MASLPRVAWPWHRLWLLGLILTLTPTSVRAQTPELRGLWATRFEWPNVNEATCKATIDEIMADLDSGNFNAVFFQIRGQADVLYPSPTEVWSVLIGGVDPGWDPLAYAIDAAHFEGLEFHAYINTHTCWASGAHEPPANPDHIFWQHCNAADPDARDWLHHTNPHWPAQFNESNYVWFAPGVPAYQAYTREQILYVVENYDVDGVHYDRIRTPGSNEPSLDPISLRRFVDPQSNPAGLDFTTWTADQITRQVRDLYAAIAAVNPTVKISAAVFSNPATAPINQHQDAPAWAQTGGLDIIVPMMYFAGGEGTTWDDRLQAWLAASGGRHVVAGQNSGIDGSDPSALIEQIELTRLRGGQGNSVFSWDGFDDYAFWDDYVAAVYTLPVTTPVMPWKAAPDTAIIHGFVTDAFGDAVVDANITRSGSSYVGLSSGDGFYSFLLVPPGAYTLDVAHRGYDPVSVPAFTVAAGDVVERNIVLGPPLTPIIAEVDPNPEEVITDQPYTQQLMLVQGTADTWVLQQGPTGAALDAHGYVRGWTPTADDGGQTFDFAARVENAVGFDEVSWSVYVQPLPACVTYALGDFEGYSPGERVLFQSPRYSGSTYNDLELTPNVAQVTSLTAYNGSQSYEVQWQYLDAEPQRWMRLTTHNAPYTPNPTVMLNRPFRFRLRLDSGNLRIALAIRETGTEADIGEDGGTIGDIEWIGATTLIDGAPQGRLVTAQPGVWQTLVFDPATDPVVGYTGDGTLWTPTNRGVFEHIAFAVVDSVGPFTVYIDDVQQLCAVPTYGDFNADADVDGADFLIFEGCTTAPGVPGAGECLAADADGDSDIDLRDFAELSRAAVRQ